MHGTANVKFHKWTCSVSKRKVQLRTHTSPTLRQVGILNFADVFERYMVNTVNTVRITYPWMCTYYIISRNYSPSHSQQQP